MRKKKKKKKKIFGRFVTRISDLVIFNEVSVTNQSVSLLVKK
jgi:hypothetical protein